MLPLVLWFLAQAPEATTPQKDDERWVLRIDLPRSVDVGGVGLFEARSTTVFLLRGPLSRAFAERCSLEIASPFAGATATHFVDPRVPLAFTEARGVLRVGDAPALMPVGPVRFALRTGGVGIGAMTAEVEGRFSLVGRRTGSGVSGTVTLDGARDRVQGPAFVSVQVSASEPARGTFSLRPTSAARCVDLSLQQPVPATAGGTR